MVLSNGFWYRIMSALLHETRNSRCSNLDAVKKQVKDAHTLTEMLNIVVVEVAKSLTKSEVSSSEAVSKEINGDESENVSKDADDGEAGEEKEDDGEDGEEKEDDGEEKEDEVDGEDSVETPHSASSQQRNSRGGLSVGAGRRRSGRKQVSRQDRIGAVLEQLQPRRSSKRKRNNQ